MHDQTNTAGVHVILHQPLLGQIDEYRRRRPNPPSRPDAIRQLAQLGLRQDGDAFARSARQRRSRSKITTASRPSGTGAIGQKAMAQAATRRGTSVADQHHFGETRRLWPSEPERYQR